MNPYGESKVMVETLLRWFDRIHGFTSVCLRYFNACGADPAGHLGEEHEPETHLIPLLLRAVLTGKPMTIFGNDYDTPDGTCIRDYIHVNDLAQAHILALDYLHEGRRLRPVQCGYRHRPHRARDDSAVEQVTGRKCPTWWGRGGKAIRRPGGGIGQAARQARMEAAISGSERHRRACLEFRRKKDVRKV